MAQGRSLHVGINQVDAASYEDWKGELQGCENDARDMRSLAELQNFKAEMLLGPAATYEKVTDNIKDAAATLVSGDFFLLTFSGHGSYIKDTNADEDDPDDETWCLWDAQLLDDELFGLLAEFDAGVRVTVIADCCFSGYEGGVLLANRLRQIPVERSGRKVIRALPSAVAAVVNSVNRTWYEEIQREYPQGGHIPINASVILLSACLEIQVAEDRPDNGVFTAALKKVWDDGRFQGDYDDFHKAIAGELRNGQIPLVRPLGASGLSVQRPFEI